MSAIRRPVLLNNVHVRAWLIFFGIMAGISGFYALLAFFGLYFLAALNVLFACLLLLGVSYSLAGE
jgi:hypothetical protein